MDTPALPCTAGIGFKPVHYDDLKDPGAVTWLEVHAENYMLEGGPRRAMLADLAARFPISAHGVGLSIGGEGALDPAHLKRLRSLMDWLNPVQFSEHLAWSSHGGAYYNDLLPLPYTERTLETVCAHVDEVQNALGRQMLLENPSSYLAFAESTMSETDFLHEVARRTGCGMLLDINNVFISATNLGLSAEAYLDAYPVEHVGEIHLAGYDEQSTETGAPLLIDSHGAPVADPVWALYARTIARIGPRPTLIEWDNDVPGFATLEREAARARTVLDLRRAA
ncbi:MNIO family bufferin maturase [Celeribacter sp. ULVN23_4]